jgi:hypothetical protein
MTIILAIAGLLVSFPFRAVAAEAEKAPPAAAEPQSPVAPARTPLDAVGLYLDGFHFKSGDMKQQMEAHHYCSQLHEDLTQCIIYDGNGPDARLMGIEYVITEKLFKSLPMDERKMWHSHHYEVKAGQLAAPGLSPEAEHDLMEKLITTYGKTWHTWGADHLHGDVPLGYPDLMMGFTADGQADPALAEARDKRFGISTKAMVQSRKDIPTPELVPGANAWETGDVVQLKLVPLQATTHGSHK